MTEQETIRLSQLSIGHKTRSGTKIVAAGMTATIRAAELTCLLGANGAGKSTLLRTLSAFQPKLAGEVFIAGREISQYTSKELSRTIGVVLTEKPDVRDMTVSDLVGLGRSPYTGFFGALTANDRHMVSQAISQVGIEPLSRRMVHTLSDGERQKVMIAKALAQQTPIIILDEPTAFLDFPSKVETMLLLRRICRETGKTIFLSTHDLELALQTADSLWLMDREHGLSIGTPQQLAQQGALSRLVERRGIHFDRETLTIRIDKE